MCFVFNVVHMYYILQGHQAQTYDLSTYITLRMYTVKQNRTLTKNVFPIVYNPIKITNACMSTH